MGNMDRGIRVVVALAIVVLYFMNVISGLLGGILLVLAAIFVVTSLVGFCPLYTLLGISTHPSQGEEGK